MRPFIANDNLNITQTPAINTQKRYTVLVFTFCRFAISSFLINLMYNVGVT